jgi:hypothetical protein
MLKVAIFKPVPEVIRGFIPRLPLRKIKVQMLSVSKGRYGQNVEGKLSINVRPVLLVRHLQPVLFNNHQLSLAIGRISPEYFRAVHLRLFQCPLAAGIEASVGGRTTWCYHHQPRPARGYRNRFRVGGYSDTAEIIIAWYLGGPRSRLAHALVGRTLQC